MNLQKITFLVLAFLLSACQSLKGGESPRRQSLFGGITNSSMPEVITAPSNNAAIAVAPSSQNNYIPVQPQAVAGLTNIDQNIWRSNVEAVALFNMISRTVAQRYVIANVDRRSLTINSEWDKFFIEGRLFRNRLSVSVFPVGQRQTEVVLKNTVEYYSGTPGKYDEATAVSWYPTPDITDELNRLVDSLNRQIASLNPQMLAR